MRKGASTTQGEATQADATQPRPTDGNGRTLDEHGLPLSGPARRAALGDQPDPRDAASPPAPTDVIDTTAQD